MDNNWEEVGCWYCIPWHCLDCSIPRLLLVVVVVAVPWVVGVEVECWHCTFAVVAVAVEEEEPLVELAVAVGREFDLALVVVAAAGVEWHIQLLQHCLVVAAAAAAVVHMLTVAARPEEVDLEWNTPRQHCCLGLELERCNWLDRLPSAAAEVAE